MARKLDPAIENILKQYGFGKDALWDCHGVWVIYHRVLEQIAAKSGITFDAPTIIEAHGDKGVATVCVFGRLKEKTEWSFGEASPHNNKNSYPWAMAEKRAKDRVILKLLGLHGEVYSEEEADEFKGKEQGRLHGPLNITELKKEMRRFADDIASVSDADEVITVLSANKAILDQCSRDLGDWYFGTENHEGAIHRIDAAVKNFKADIPEGLLP